MQEILSEARARNPYPEDVFTEPSKEEYAQLRELLKSAGIIQDRFFGSYGRKVWNNCVDEIKRLIEQQKTLLKTIDHAKRLKNEDPHLANYILRDLPIIKEARLDALSWSMHREGCVEEDVDYLIEQLEKYIKSETGLYYKKG